MIIIYDYKRTLKPGAQRAIIQQEPAPAEIYPLMLCLQLCIQLGIAGIISASDATLQSLHVAARIVLFLTITSGGGGLNHSQCRAYSKHSYGIPTVLAILASAI